MADINIPIELSADSKKIIADKKLEQNFSYQSWGDTELEAVRSEIRNYYKTKQNAKCAFCQQPVSLVSAFNCQVEHIVPKKLHEDFMFTPTNLCVICADCNQIKRDQETLNEIPETMTQASKRKKYPRSSGAFKIVHPHFDVWHDHIVIFDDLYVDQTMKGHFTIGACKLNRKLHEFGYVEEITNDEQISELMNQFLEETDSIKRRQLLNKIKKIK
ncbi:HNH endonuclease family protein [Tenacibaculum litopenaei]|uniref:HNH endonuclease n=1 Tax=Tenacibaculum litopenaei TaxID=396016 RepID=UPI0038937ADF